MRAPEFWYDPRKAATPALLSPLASLYTAAGTFRQALVQPAPAPVPVVCVGNLVAGGAGKTPVALALVELARPAGLETAFLTRGHGGRATGPLLVDPERHDPRTVGDEPLLLAAAAATWVARDRCAGAAAAAEAGARLIIMDDGFQNPRLGKDVSLLVIDGESGLGNGRVMPAGPLREPLDRALTRADAVVLMGRDRHGLRRALAPRLPVLGARLAPTAEGETLAGMRVLAFAGIGRPAKFFETLAELGCAVVARHAFPDHHRYRPDEIMRLCEDADVLDALPVTTAKDLVRLPPEARPMVRVLPVTAEWEDTDAVVDLLAPVLKRARAHV
ncbi:MAG: tetraacyldisaccharide 4'-kinase [Alphaproteobacteria bacterium]